jgi:eukaryotic-like serine/threonine-protein kinase
MKTALNLPPLIASRYLPVRLIGRGGMGAVYEVEHVRTGEHLALKVLLSGWCSSAEVVERFKREARAASLIKSEHVVRVTDADVAPELEGAPFLVMELLDGMDLEQAAAASPPGPETVVAWLRQVAQAIDKAHRLGIIHRDLKPENLFLAKGEGRRPIVKVLDFGIAKMIEDGTGVTGAGQMLGTPKYMSPEQATPNAPVTPATDRCALGLVAYRLLVGESYYQGGAMGILGQILHGDLQPPSARGSHLRDPFDAWFLKACHRNPERRFASASEQIEGLAEALGLPRAGSEVTLPGVAARLPTNVIEPSRSRRPVPIAGLVAAGISAAAIVGLLVHRRGGGTGGAGTIPVPASMTRPAAVASPAPPPPPAPVAEVVPRPPLRPATTDAPAAEIGGVLPMAARAVDRRRVPRRPDATAPSVAGTVLATPKARADSTDPYADQK